MRTVDSKIAAALLLPLGLGAATAAYAADIVGTAEQRGRFDTLVRALRAAGVADTLAEAGPFTLFAPTDEAFAALPEGLLDDLLAGDPDRLERLLGHHVVAGRRYPSTGLPPTLEPLAGGPIAVELRGGGLTLRNAAGAAADEGAPDADDLGGRLARVVAADIDADNGIMHAIDAVLVPPDLARALAAPGEEPPAATAEPAESPEVATPRLKPEEGIPPADAAAEIVRRELEATIDQIEPEELAEPRLELEEGGRADAAAEAVGREPEATVGRAGPPDGDGRPAEPEAAAAGDEPDAAVERAEPEVTVVPPEAPPPEAPGAEVTVEMAEPTVTVERPEPPPTAAEPTEAPAAATEEPTAVAEEQEEVAAREEGAGPEAAPPAEGPEEAADGLEGGTPGPPTRVDVASFGELTGRTVRSREGERTGAVSDIIFLKETGEIGLVIVEFGGFFGLFAKSVAVPWREVRFDDQEGDLVVEMDASEIEAAPAFNADELNEALYEAYVDRRPPPAG